MPFDEFLNLNRGLIKLRRCFIKLHRSFMKSQRGLMNLSVRFFEYILFNRFMKRVAVG